MTDNDDPKADPYGSVCGRMVVRRSSPSPDRQSELRAKPLLWQRQHSAADRWIKPLSFHDAIKMGLEHNLAHIEQREQEQSVKAHRSQTCNRFSHGYRSS